MIRYNKRWILEAVQYTKSMEKTMIRCQSSSEWANWAKKGALQWDVRWVSCGRTPADPPVSSCVLPLFTVSAPNLPVCQPPPSLRANPCQPRFPSLRAHVQPRSSITRSLPRRCRIPFRHRLRDLRSSNNKTLFLSHISLSLPCVRALPEFITMRGKRIETGGK